MSRLTIRGPASDQAKPFPPKAIANARGCASLEEGFVAESCNHMISRRWERGPHCEAHAAERWTGVASPSLAHNLTLQLQRLPQPRRIKAPNISGNTRTSRWHKLAQVAAASVPDNLQVDSGWRHNNVASNIGRLHVANRCTTVQLHRTSGQPGYPMQAPPSTYLPVSEAWHHKVAFAYKSPAKRPHNDMWHYRRPRLCMLPGVAFPTEGAHRRPIGGTRTLQAVGMATWRLARGLGGAGRNSAEDTAATWRLLGANTIKAAQPACRDALQRCFSCFEARQLAKEPKGNESP